MSLDFVKNTANYISYGTASFNPFLNGASKLAISARIQADTYSTTDIDQNKIINVMINGTSTGLQLCIDANGGAQSRVRCGARSTSADAQQYAVGSTNVGTALAHVGGAIDYAADSISVYVDGALDTTSGVTFTSATYTPGAAAGNDRIGGDGFFTPPTAVFQFDGRIADVAIWRFDASESSLTADEWAALGKGFSPLMIRPANLIFCEPFMSRLNSVPDKVSGLVGTITGTLNYADHASTILRHSRQSFVPSTQTIPLAFSTDVVRSAVVSRSALLNAVVPVVHTLVKGIIGELNKSVSVIRTVLSSVDIPTITSISVSITRTVSAAATFASVATAAMKFTGTAGLGLLLRPVSRWTRRPKRR